MNMAVSTFQCACSGKFNPKKRTENMNKMVTVLAPIRLAAGKTEADLLVASDRFQKEFADAQPGLIRRELIRTGTVNILISSSSAALRMRKLLLKRKGSAACHAFFQSWRWTQPMQMAVLTFIHHWRLTAE